MEDEIRTKNHKTRLAKVELYLEVPTSSGDIVLGESGTLDRIETALAKEDITFTSFGDINLSPIFDDNIEEYKEPVGYLAPDGKFYVIEASEYGLAHLRLSHVVYDKYFDTEYIQRSRLSGSIEYSLERNGFIKVHEHEIRYCSHLPINPYSDDEIYSPDPTEAQKKALIEYAKRINMELRGKYYIFVNDTEYEVKDFVKILKDGDELSIRKMFEL